MPQPPIAAVRAACKAQRGELLGYPVAACACDHEAAEERHRPCLDAIAVAEALRES